jgi:hypothetical protein
MMSKPIVPAEQLEAVIRQMPDVFTILDFVDAFQEAYPDIWDMLVERYGLYGSGTRYSALTYLSNRISAYARRKAAALLEPTPKGWKPEGRALSAPHHAGGTPALRQPLDRHLPAEASRPEG